MTYSRDFKSVRIADDQTTIEVSAHSIDDDTGEPGSKDPATEIYVALLKVPCEGEALVSEPVTAIGARWTALVRDATGSLSLGDEVRVTGIARTGDDAPRVWEETLHVRSKTGDDDE